MNTPNPLDALAAEPLDDLDAVIMRDIALLYSAADPVPADLVDRLKFAMTLDALNAELAEIQQLPLEAMAARGLDTSEVKTLTFTSDSLTTMVSISPAGPDRVRIDGWCAPGGGASVELRQVEHARTTIADEDGRFVFDDVPHGLTRFTMQVVDDRRPPVVTPAVEL